MKPVSHLIFLIAVACLALAPAAFGADFYISLKGSDGNPGTRAKPFATLDRARDAVRAAGHGAPVTVWLAGGSYVRTESFVLSAQDSGTESVPVVYRAMPGAAVRILGGRVVRGFRPWRGRILQLDLRKQGITEYGQLTPRGFGRSHTGALELFFDGRPMTLARWPNRGWAHIGAATPDKATDQFAFDGDRPLRWLKAPDAWVHGYWTYDWADSYERVASIDAQAHVIHTAAPHGVYGYTKERRWRVVNVLEELDEPGEWYLDRSAGVLYFWPPKPINSAEAIVSLLAKPLVALDGAAHIEFRDVTFGYTRGDAVVIRNGMHNVLRHCVIANTGNRGVVVQGGSNNGVEDSELRDIGDGAIRLEGGDRPSLTPGGQFALRNHIYRFGRWSRTYTPGIELFGVGDRAAGNTIDHAPHTAILLHGNEHVVERNDIHSVAMETGDVGAYYLGRDWTERGNVARGNYLHNLGNGDVNAIYLDDCASGTIVTDNVIQGAHRGAMIGGGRDNLFRGNKFVDCDIAIHFDARGLGWANSWFNGKDTTLFDRLKAMPYSQEPWRSRYPQLLTVASDDPARPKGNIVEDNQSWSGKWIDYLDKLTEHDLTLRNNAVNARPGAVDPAWVKGIGLDIDTPVIARRLTVLSPASVKLVIENQGRTAASGVFDVWVDPEGAATLRTPASISFALQAGERRTVTIEVERHAPAVVGVELRGEGVAPEGVALK